MNVLSYSKAFLKRPFLQIVKKIFLLCYLLILSTPIIEISNANQAIYVQQPIRSLVGNDHTFSGSLIKLRNGKLIHFFRLDTGILGNHVGNHASIAKRISMNNGKTWSKPQVIYKDEYDDRISSAYLLDNGNIIVFFFRYNTIGTWSGYTVDNNYIMSKNGGKTWSKRIFIDDAKNSGSFMSVFKIKGKKGYFVPTYGKYYVDIRYSPDGYNWNRVYCKWDFRKDSLYDISEPTFTSIGKGRIIGLFRVENCAIHQVISSDNGKTWSALQETSIANGFFCPYPNMVYDTKLKKLITIITDRRGGNYSELNKKSGLWVYINNADKIFSNPKGYSSSRFYTRPNPNRYRMLGYTSSVKINKSTFLVLFSDSYKKENRLENADYYQCYISLYNNGIVKNY